MLIRGHMIDDGGNAAWKNWNEALSKEWLLDVKGRELMLL